MEESRHGGMEGSPSAESRVTSCNYAFEWESYWHTGLASGPDKLKASEL